MLQTYNAVVIFSGLLWLSLPLCKSGSFYLTQIAWSTEQADEKCRAGPGRGRETGNQWPTSARKKTPVTVGGPLNESSLRVWAVGQTKMIAIKQAKPAGTSGASIHPGLTPSRDLLAPMLSVFYHPFCGSTFQQRVPVFTYNPGWSSIERVL